MTSKQRRSIPPEVPSAILRDCSADHQAIERIWQRLDEELPAQRLAGPRSTAWVWAAAAAVLLFGSGVWVGARAQTPTAESKVLPHAEPEATTRAAGDDAPPAATEAVPVSTETAQPTDRRLAPVPRLPRVASSGGDGLEAPAAARPTGPPEWQRLAEGGEYPAAFQAIQEQGGFDAVMAQASAEQLMTLAEVARANRQRGRASQALRQLLARYPSDANAPLAALSLGNLLEAAGDRKGAAEAFGLYRSLSPDGDFAEDALARQVMAAIEQGNLELARKLAGQYEKDYPSGRRAQEIRDALSEAEASDAGAAEADAALPDVPPAAGGAAAKPVAPVPAASAKPPVK